MAEKKEKRRRPFQDWVPDEALDHAHAAREHIRSGFEAFLPPEFVEHRRAASKEALLAARSLIDAALERVEARQE